ncbi:hypothetical protein JHK84_030326 [Glycine max]|uniref:Uncharacterized protein n=1 Tax=Glycine soja TaxID=3848 RepID=A0A0B2PZ77_GLYSO|nr:hypothetical protein JHK85_030726 [Glycine max]KAG4993361.1 hypothetical protein JHK86_030188 [Glycine max]KAG5144783.1 hypothetical protein JHK84_030326 [Glycine max]KHN12989.1 hypothetical protein glysoja_027277 [Glycine soja]
MGRSLGNTLNFSFCSIQKYPYFTYLFEEIKHADLLIVSVSNCVIVFSYTLLNFVQA